MFVSVRLPTEDQPVGGGRGRGGSSPLVSNFLDDRQRLRCNRQRTLN